MQEYVQNGFKVGPNYCRPPAPVAPDWIDAADKRLRRDGDDLSKWWTVFNDPVLDNLICCAYHQNLTLRQAGCRILKARAQLGIAVGELFPQTQTMTGDYTRNAVSREIANVQFAYQAVLQPMGLRVQPQLGAGLLGPIPPGDRIERREPGRLG